MWSVSNSTSTIEDVPEELKRKIVPFVFVVDASGYLKFLSDVFGAEHDTALKYESGKVSISDSIQGREHAISICILCILCILCVDVCVNPLKTSSDSQEITVIRVVLTSLGNGREERAARWIEDMPSVRQVTSNATSSSQYGYVLRHCFRAIHFQLIASENDQVLHRDAPPFIRRRRVI